MSAWDSHEGGHPRFLHGPRAANRLHYAHAARTICSSPLGPGKCVSRNRIEGVCAGPRRARGNPPPHRPSCRRRRSTACTADTTARVLAAALDRAVDLFNTAFLLSGTLKVYVESFVSTNSYDTAAAKKLSELEIVQVRVRQAWTRFQVWMKRHRRRPAPCPRRTPGAPASTPSS